MNATRKSKYFLNLKENLSTSNYIIIYLLTLIFRLAEELLAKETFGLVDIVKVLGTRPFPMKETLKEYLIEMTDRQDEEIKKEQEL